MRPGARLAAAMDILETIVTRHQPVSIALADWGKAHRFAGSGDRNAIGHLVYDALRDKASSAFVMGSDTPRALVFGSSRSRGTAVEALAEMCSGHDHAPPPLTDDERARLSAYGLEGAPPWIAGNYPEWLHGAFEQTFGQRAVDEGQALATRAPVDLRVNTLKATSEKVLKALQAFGAVDTRFAPHGVRIAAPTGDGRIPNLEAEAAFQAGWFEIQDEGSQIAAALSGAAPRLQILDFCAGGGGKTLAMAAEMQNTGQIFAYDDDRNRLKPIFQRLKRANARNVQVLRGGDRNALAELGARFDIVLVDAPCTGTGTWRRRPESKWKLRPRALGERVAEQNAILQSAARHVKPGGRLVYVTCSILPEENIWQVTAFAAENPDFAVIPFGDAWRAHLKGDPPLSADGQTDTLLLTPGTHDTDGFFIAILEKRPLTR